MSSEAPELYTGPVWCAVGTDDFPLVPRLFVEGVGSELPCDEITAGLVRYEISVNGDAPTIALVKVWATSPERARAIFDKLARRVHPIIVDIDL